MNFILLWVTIAVLMLAGIAAVLVWAVRNRQFSDQDRARHLPLLSGIPEERSEVGGQSSGIRIQSPPTAVGGRETGRHPDDAAL